MRTLTLFLVALACVVGGAPAQRRARIGPTVSTISIEDGSGSHAFSSFGGAVAVLSGDDGEMGVAISRYGDLSNNTCVRQLTFFGLESNYYPVGPKGFAPYASTTFGLARVTDQDAGLLGICTAAEATSEFGLGFGLGLRLNLGSSAAAFVEGRFFQVPNSAIQALEGRANVSVAFGSPRKTQLLNGTLGPALGFLTHLSGPFNGSPTVGMRFRRDTKKGTLGLQIDYTKLNAVGCTTACKPNAILFAPGFEPSLRTAWGRLYADLGLLLVGFPSVGPDRGMSQGAHGGIGADIVSAGPLMWNLNSRVLWFQRNGGANVFLLQTGLSVSPKLESR